jgi:transposase
MKSKSLPLIGSAYLKANTRKMVLKHVRLFDIDISRVVTEYQAQRLVNEKGQCFIAPFPDEVTKAVQYGNGIEDRVKPLSLLY